MLWVGGCGLLPGSVYQPPAFERWLLTHSCCPSTLSFCSVFCPNPWPLVHGPGWSLRQGCLGNQPQIFHSPSCRELWLYMAASLLLLVYLPDSCGSDLLKLLCANQSLRCACVPVRCYLLSFRYSAYYYFKWGDPSLHHASDVTLQNFDMLYFYSCLFLCIYWSLILFLLWPSCSLLACCWISTYLCFFQLSFCSWSQVWKHYIQRICSV